MSMGHNDQKQRTLSAELGAQYAAFLARGGRVYAARCGESAMVGTSFNNKQDKTRPLVREEELITWNQKPNTTRCASNTGLSGYGGSGQQWPSNLIGR